MKQTTEVWLRFILYKILEIVGAGVVSIGAYWLGKLICSWFPKENQQTGWFALWLLGFIALIFLGIIITGIVMWIMWNWEIAKEDTEARRSKISKKR